MSEFAKGLQLIVGLTLSGVSRALDMGIFSFGSEATWVDADAGEVREASEYAIHVQCPFRLTRKGHILVGSHDISAPRDALTDAASRKSDKGMATAFDVIVDRIVKGTRLSPLVARGVTVTACGDLRVDLSDHVAIEAFPMSASPSEAWRFFKRGGEHLIFPSGHDSAGARQHPVP